jgi:predicted esterase
MKKCNLIVLVLSMALLAVGQIANAQQTAEKYVVETDYWFYLPDGYNASDTITKWPLLLFLHGAGETGNDIDKVKVHGPSKLIEQGKKFPFIVVSPQTRQYGWKSEQLLSLLTNLIEKYNVDTDRLYLTGLSMGGFGTWKLAADYPIFAAIIPICGGGDPSTAFKFRHTPIWCFHGAKDDIVNIEQSQRMVDAVKKYKKDVKFTIYPEANHDSWTETYENDEIYDWLLQHKLFEYKEVAVNQAVLAKYAGNYKGDDGAIIKVVYEDNKLFLDMGKFKPQLKPASETEFFVYEKHPNSCVFQCDEKGNVTGAYFYSEKEAFHKKME